MQRTTIMLPSELKIAAQARANELGISVGKLIRDALQLSLAQDKKGKESDMLFSDFSAYKGDTPTDLAENHDEYLYGEKK